MKLGRVLGTLVATVKSPGLEGVRFLVVQELDRQQHPKGEPIIAADATATAGTGDLVYVIGGREAAVALAEQFVPVDHTIVGIVDEVDQPDVPPIDLAARWHVTGKK
ncbi:MAG: EutN/CcmL family microcompartment protein [Chloroflexi bacterium]|nr:EutN/CcmL family microcompartment protein [Chloroflexota bacterium]